ncbi:TonB-dependent receptor [Kineobactrum salinum]|uniref:TonB-dependent receptor n=1 Tax=Kineobactrum salinum TaxID=2708301 RepID=A0A6C0TY26_9GAMM|nr:TonB-dependent receptor [Kineobactrum salinum]QIB64538.1 TonB-dependent receptor [Kineobactrum salinum]
MDRKSSAKASRRARQRAGLVGVAAVWALAGSALAATDDSDAALQGPRLEEVIVTASKRQESLQDVSASISAFTHADIKRLGLDNFEDFARRVPGVTLNQAVKNRSVFNIRGVTTSLFGGNTQDPVSVYINETPVTDTFGAIVQPDLRLFDVERIEVLRGPQGTLFGSGSLGGTVRILTRQPDPSAPAAEGRIDTGVTDGGHWRQRYDGMVNVPLLENTLALRLVGYHRDEEGWVKNVSRGSRNSTEDWGGRAALLWRPGEAFYAKLEVIHQDSDPEDGDAFNPDLGKFRKASTISEARPSTLTNYSLTMEYEFPGFATLLSATSFQQSDTASYADLGDFLGLGASGFNVSDPWESEFITQELRLVSNTDSALEWLVGSFFIDRTTDAAFLVQAPGLSEAFGGLIPTDDLFQSDIETTSRELAAFADVGYRFSPQWKVQAGIRVFDTEVSYSEPDRNTLNFATFAVDNTAFRNTGTDSDYTWRAGISYEPGDDMMLYANISRGYRIGQVNPNKGPSLTDPDDLVIPEAYDPDSSINYELGAKTTWLQGRLIANLALYYIDWTDIQVNGARVSDMQTFIANAGDARSQGLEIELSAMPLEGLDLNLALTFQDAKMTGVADDIIVAATDGETLPGSVDFKMSGGIQYSWAAFGDKQMYARADVQYVGSSPNDFGMNGGNPFFAMNESYENVGAALGLVAKRWNLTLYGENLSNNDSFILTNGGGTPNYVNSLRPLTVGVRLGFSY